MVLQPDGAIIDRFYRGYVENCILSGVEPGTRE